MGKAGPRPRTFAEVMKAIWLRIEVKGPDECWPWTGRRTPTGYGMVQARGLSDQPLYTHRLVLAESLGRELLPGMESCHSCDYPPCNNPKHLFEGTHQGNMQDSQLKGRFKIGGDWKKFI